MSPSVRLGVRRRSHVLAVLASTLVALTLTLAGPARATVIDQQDWESGLGAWTTTGADWHVQADPQNVTVSPAINPSLVTLPDSGALPSAFDGNHVAWFGDASNGTYCGADFATNSLNPPGSRNGCSSSAIPQGELISPVYDLTNASSVILQFASWFEIESVNSNVKDVMSVDYSIDGGSTWRGGVSLNPLSNPGGHPSESYSDNGLGVSPSWQQAEVDLSAAAGQSNVRFRFVFNAGDKLYNGFRGWLVDSIELRTPFDAAPAAITSVDTCQGGAPASVLVLHGQGFIQGSVARVDGAPVSTSISSTSHAEIPAPAPGTHTVQLVAPGSGGQAGNVFAFTNGDCAGATGTGAAPSGPSGGQFAAPGGIAPVLTPTTPGAPVLIGGLQVSPGSFRAARSRVRPRPVSIRFTMRAPAPVVLTALRVVPGRLDRGRCVGATPRLRRRPSCNRLLLEPASVRVSTRVGANATSFSGRLGGLALPTGTYVLVATPMVGGRSTPPAMTTFRVLAPRGRGHAAPPLILR